MQAAPQPRPKASPDHATALPRWRAWALAIMVVGAAATVLEGSLAGLRAWRADQALAWLVPLTALGAGSLAWSLLALATAPLLALLTRGWIARWDPQQSGELGRLALLALLGSMGVATATALITWRAERITNRPLAIALIALTATLPVLVAAAGVGLATLRRGRPRVSSPRRVGLRVSLPLVGYAAVLVGYLYAFDQALASLRVLLWLAVAGLLVLLLGLLALARPLRAAAWVRRAQARSTTILVAVTVITCLLISATVLQLRPAAAASLLRGGGPAARSLRILQRLSDFDGDGAAAWMGGTDCAPFDARRHLLALEIPGNGIDEDCDGVDADSPAAGQKTLAARYPTVPKALMKRRNILLVAIDALRGDHVGYAGYPRPITPYLDQLAAKSWVFTRALSPSSTTRQSLAAMFTGRWVTGVKMNPGHPIDQIDASNLLLPEMLHPHGYRSMAVVDEWLPKFLRSFKQGFDSFEPAYRVGSWKTYGQQAAGHTNAAAMKRLLEHNDSKPYLLYLHYEAPHFPYVRHPTLPEFGNQPRDLYDNEIAYADRALGQLLDMFAARGWLTNTIVVVFGDHGEEFGEHGGSKHSRTLYAESLHVPLLIHVPGQDARVIDTPVSLIDVVPTLLDLLGLPAPAASLQGQSLLYPLLAGPPAQDRAFLGELKLIEGGKHEELRSLRLGAYKLIWNMTSGQKQAFDIRTDPEEHSPLSDPALLSRLSQRLQGELAAATSQTAIEAAAPP